MKLWLIIAGSITLGCVFVAGVFWLILSMTDAEREAGKAFIRAFSEGDVAAAHALSHPSLIEELPPERIAGMITGAAAYSEVSWRSFQKANEHTSMQGVATTAGGCVSQVEVDILLQKVTRFEISPLCPAE